MVLQVGRSCVEDGDFLLDYLDYCHCLIVFFQNSEKHQLPKGSEKHKDHVSTVDLFSEAVEL